LQAIKVAQVVPPADEREIDYSRGMAKGKLARGRETRMGMAWEIPWWGSFKSNDCASSELLVTFFRPKDTGCSGAEW